MIEKDSLTIAFAARLSQDLIAYSAISIERLFRFASVRDDALFITLASHTQHHLFPVHIRKIQSGQFADAQSGSIKQFENCAIAFDQKAILAWSVRTFAA